MSFTDCYEESLTSAHATVASQESSFTATTHDVGRRPEFIFELRFNEEPGSGATRSCGTTTPSR